MRVCVSSEVQLSLGDWEPLTPLSAFPKAAKVGERPACPEGLSLLFVVYLRPTGHAGADGDGAAHVPPERVHVPQDA